jgi:hypothetical protein
MKMTTARFGRFASAAGPTVLVAALTIALAACSTHGGGARQNTRPQQRISACTDGSRPVCYERFGRTIRCACASRSDFERLLGTF